MVAICNGLTNSKAYCLNKAMTNEQYLEMLYAGSRRAPLTADDHENLKKAAEALLKALKPKEDKVVEFNEKEP